MVAEIISGNKIGALIREELKAKVAELKEKGVTPGLAVVLVGEDPASQVYVRNKGKGCEEIGVFEKTFELPKETSEAEVLKLVKELNNDPKFHGILVQLPLPSHIDSGKVLLAIDPDKDVDGFHPVNVGRLTVGEPGFVPCTPAGVIELLMRSGNDPEGKHVVIVGRSNIVGKPLLNLLVQKRKGGNATVTCCHTRTKNMAEHVRQADIIIAAAGAPSTVTGEMIREGAVVIDVGVNRIDDPTSEKGFRLVGDVDKEGAQQKAKARTPVPGGVGPMTITMLLKNTVWAAERTLGQ